MKLLKRHLALGLLLGALSTTLQAAEKTPLPQGARLAIVGDSITEQKLYSKYMEAYLLACAGRSDMAIFQFGWSGETASGLAGRIANDLAVFNPTVATLCYGMNDGQYRPMTDDIGRSYEKNMRKVIEGLKKHGVQTVVVGSPGAVDTKYFVRNNFAPLSGAEGYNRTLAALRDIDRRLADEYDQVFADVHQPMIDAMAKAKAALGEDYDVCGRDGFHPGPNGHLIMAYAFLKALGCDGAIAELTVDMKGQAQASKGHKVLRSEAGRAEVQSIRYPFCFDPDPKASHSTRSIAPFFPFNQDLNRFVLKVKNLDAPKAKVTWGNESKEFSGEQLAQGINLAAEFPATPFDSQFRQVIEAVGAKQNFETAMIKNLITQFRGFNDEAQKNPELASAFKAVGQQLSKRQQELDKTVRNAIQPINHTLTVSAVQ